ncbi:hypothetical protein M3Y97_00178200 [Aphelenchoides bicaudatus]|nr:hypothetical protein M3Y97_00178200 [Aphelenchoides bicaudatus]
MSLVETLVVEEGSITIIDPVFDPFLPQNVNGSIEQPLVETAPQERRGKKKRRTVTLEVINLLAYASLFYFIYPIFFAFLFYVIVYHSFRKRSKWILIPYFIYEMFYLLYNIFLAIIFFMYSAHTLEFQYLTGTPTHIAEIIGALELLIIPCQCTFFFIMIQCWHGSPISEFLPQGKRERKYILGIMALMIIATISVLMWAQISGFI